MLQCLFAHFEALLKSPSNYVAQSAAIAAQPQHCTGTCAVTCGVPLKLWPKYYAFFVSVAQLHLQLFNQKIWTVYNHKIVQQACSSLPLTAASLFLFVLYCNSIVL